MKPVSKSPTFKLNLQPSMGFDDESPRQAYSNSAMKAKVINSGLNNKNKSFAHPYTIQEHLEEEEDELVSRRPMIKKLDLNLVKSYDQLTENMNMDITSKSAILHSEAEESNEDEMFKEDKQILTKVKL
jgi:hypothetical protein